MYLYSVNIESIHQSTFWTFISHTTISSRFTVSEMKRIYRGFKTECPTGLITEEAFQGIYSRFFPHGGTVHFHSIVSTLYKSNVKFLTPVLPAKMRIFFCGFWKIVDRTSTFIQYFRVNWKSWRTSDEFSYSSKLHFSMHFLLQGPLKASYTSLHSL